MASTLASGLAVGPSGLSRLHAPAGLPCAPSHQLALQRRRYLFRGVSHERAWRRSPGASIDDRPSSVEAANPFTSAKGSGGRMRMWGDIAWWIVVSYSVPFAFYTLPFIYGDFEIYKHLTVNALKENHQLAGLHIANHLSTWQIHSAAALLFISIGPFQFNASFRSKYPVIHKRLGYVFALCTIVTAVTGGTTMREASELGPIASGMTPFMSAGTLVALAISVHAARHRNFQAHRRWMLRSAAIGYSVMYTRMLPVFIQVIFGLSIQEALDCGFPLSLALNSGLAEIYIQVYLSQRDEKRAFPQDVDTTVEDNDRKVF